MAFFKEQKIRTLPPSPKCATLARMSFKLILASTSIYRKALMDRLGFPFEAVQPTSDEEAGKIEFFAQHTGANKGPRELALYLAHHKAKGLAGPGRIVVGGDQLVAFEGKILGKPGSRDKAVDQLFAMQGKSHELLTAVSVHAPTGVTEFVHGTHIVFRKLLRSEIERVVDRDKSWDVAGAYKFEASGITLMESLECSDPSAIEGLPLIELGRILRSLTSGSDFR